MMKDKKLTVKYRVMFCLAAALIMFGNLSLTAQEKLPKPSLILTEKKDVVNYGYEMMSYRLEVVNKTDYPAEMFEVAPDLPPCGRNTNSSRTWIDIFSADKTRIYGFCAIKSVDELDKLIFMVPRKRNLDKVYIVIYDRRLNKRYRSAAIAVDGN